jgi:hypothetical protein
LNPAISAGASAEPTITQQTALAPYRHDASGWALLGLTCEALPAPGLGSAMRRSSELLLRHVFGFRGENPRRARPHAQPGRIFQCTRHLAITVNRWFHGYGYVANSLFDGDDYEETLRRARQPAGRVAIANSDASADVYAHLAIDHAERAVHELLKRRDSASLT